jgi:prevent-host-death family protein
MTSRPRRLKSSPSSAKLRRKPGSTGKERRVVRKVALAKVKDDLSRYLRLAQDEEIVITRHGQAAGVLIGFDSEEDWFDYRVEHHPEFLRLVAEARAALRAEQGLPLEDVKD